MTVQTLSVKVTVEQPSLRIGNTGEPSLEALITFGTWFKGEKGDSWDDDFELATEQDIDNIFTIFT